MKAMDCADYIIDYALSHKLKINNLQLQKTLYVFAVEYMRLTDVYPYDEDILAWNYGPTILNVYKEYEHYGSLEIEKISTHPTFNPKTTKFTHKIYNIVNIDKTYQSIIERYLKSFLSLDIFEVVDFMLEQEFYQKYRKIIHRTDDFVYPLQEIHLDGMTLKEFLNTKKGDKEMNYVVNEKLIDEIEDILLDKYSECLLSWETEPIIDNTDRRFVTTLYFCDCEIYLIDGDSIGYKINNMDDFPWGDKPFQEVKELLKSK